MKKVIRVAVVIALMGIPTLGAADDPPDAGTRHWPRPEAVAACKDKGEGDACTFEGRHGTVSGTCRKVPSGEVACLHPHRHPHGGTGS